MATSYSSRRTSSVTRSRSREEPEVTLDDVAVVVAGLNSKVLQLRREIRAMRESPQSGETDGRSGRSNAKRRRRKLAERKPRETRSEDNEYYFPPAPFWFEEMPCTERDSRHETRKNSSDQRNCRKNLIRAVDRQESSISGETTRAKSTSVCSGRGRRPRSKNQMTQTFELPKNPKLSPRHRVREVAVNSETLRSHEERRKSKEPKKSEAKMVSNGNRVRRVRKKRISRGVQVELKDNKKSTGLRGCFALKCCVAKNKKANKTGVENSKDKQYSSESSEAYKPRAIEREKKRKKRKPEKDRISGGGERLTYQKFKNGDVSLPPRVSRVNNPHRHSGRSRSSGQATEDRWVQKNEAADVKRRLNECLIELNGIVGDVSHLFKKNLEIS